MHNRASRNIASSGNSKRGGFDIRKTFGRYHVKCPRAASSPWVDSDDDDATGASDSTLDIYRLSTDGQSLLGELNLAVATPPLQCEVIFTGNRKTLLSQIERLESVNTPENGSEVESQDSEDAQDDDEESPESKQRRRFQTFEKNSFREPKFWLRWRSSVESGSGYVVFSGNDCRRFRGTITCEARDWDNVAIEGWKAVGMSERDVAFRWGRDTPSSAPDDGRRSSL